MNVDTAFAALVEANPVPDAEGYAEQLTMNTAFLTATRERSERMKTLEEPTQTKPTKQRSWHPGIAVTAFLLVIALGIATVIAVRGGTEAADLPAPPFDTPEEAALAFYEVRAANDWVAYSALLSDDALNSLLDPAGTASPEKIKARFTDFNLQNITERDPVCKRNDSMTVVCEITARQPVMDAIGGEDFAEIHTFRIDDAGFVSWIAWDRSEWGATNAELMQGFAAWLAEEEPGLAAEYPAQVWGSDELVRPVEEIFADSLAAAKVYKTTVLDVAPAEASGPPFETIDDAVAAYFNAVNDGDWDAYLSMMAEDANDGVLFGALNTDLDTVRWTFDRLEVDGTVFSFEGCAPCKATITGGIDNQITGLAEIPITVSMSLNDEGLINTIGLQGPGSAINSWVAFDQFLTAEYPALYSEWNSERFEDGPPTRPIPEIVSDMEAAIAAFHAQSG